MTPSNAVTSEHPWPWWRYALAALLPSLMAVAVVTVPLGDDDGKKESWAAYERVRKSSTYQEIPDALAAYDSTRMVCRQLSGLKAAPCAKLEVVSDGKHPFFLDPFHRFHVDVGPTGRILSVSQPEYINPD